MNHESFSATLLAEFRPSSGQKLIKMVVSSVFWPLSGQVYTLSILNLVHTLVVCNRWSRNKTGANFLAATKQLYDWFSPSVCLSVRPSVCHTFFTMFPSSYHHEIFRSCYHGQKCRHAKGPGQRSKVKVTEVNTQLSRFRTLTPVWIHIWQWNHAHSWKQHRRGALLFFKVIRQISRSHGSKNRRIWPRLGVSGL